MSRHACAALASHTMPAVTPTLPHRHSLNTYRNKLMLSIKDIRDSHKLCELLGYFDVEIGDHIVEDWYAINEIAAFDSFGGEGAGGRYVLLPAGHVLFISSEGSAGVIANNFVAFLDLVSGCPYWQGILHFSHGGDFDCMTQAEELLRSDPRNEEDWPSERVAELRGLLGLGVPQRSYAKTLHAVVTNSEGNPNVLAFDGTPYGNLFGSFKPSDNPNWSAA
ncbi:MAG: hypothetical protein KKB95_08745 [Gammaproteobacteria bacterium]|nr:hypothetical protein [Gammaproteobacteria bacterium]MBU1507585.1 hypothetical protein [Gammaproteobacteria bacterium]MBU2119310.1 hypothetical protein [Gammaproteobacteria bacterium]MBU2172418.1 hypothetical protein [Gammaproteobacteria bacterium]MBU2200115.1 hypothetical protein [Gammaproteobacteria bacterium]